MDLLRDAESDSLDSLEERILNAVRLVTELRHQNERMAAERDAAVQEAQAVRSELAAASREIEALKSERGQVRGRIERLLSQIDDLSAG